MAGMFSFTVDREASNMSEQMSKVLQECLSYLADLNGSNWIEGDSPGSKDMRNRAKALQEKVYKVVAPAGRHFRHLRCGS
jgi:hypothetical protein